MSDEPEAWRENVAAIVMDAAGRVLLGCAEGARKQYLHFPQGGVGRRETLEEALHRELWEVVGLAPDRYCFVASYGGLRYHYRKRNEKRERWLGQQQTYFLLQCYDEMPATNCGGSDEFTHVEWLPWQTLAPEMFVSFKRKVVAKALRHFFPSSAAEGGAPVVGFDFGGGKVEAAVHLARLSLKLCSLQKRLEACGGRLLIVLHGQQGSGRRQAARRLASLMDSLRLRIVSGAGLLLLPAGGETVLLLGEGKSLPPFEGHVLRLFLQVDALSALPCAAEHWLHVPSEQRWYRDLLLAQAVVEALESLVTSPPLAIQHGGFRCSAR